jgi:tRNA A-37 threonylcarbamoyl transferase component Bud32
MDEHNKHYVRYNDWKYDQWKANITSREGPQLKAGWGRPLTGGEPLYFENSLDIPLPSPREYEPIISTPKSIPDSYKKTGTYYDNDITGKPEQWKGVRSRVSNVLSAAKKKIPTGSRSSLLGISKFAGGSLALGAILPGEGISNLIGAAGSIGAYQYTKGSRGLKFGAAAAVYAATKGIASLFSGRDDTYNTIEGLRHGGMAERGRKQLTEFGSGYQGKDESSFGDVLSGIGSFVLTGAAGLTGYDRFGAKGAIGGAAIGALIGFGSSAIQFENRENALGKTLWNGMVEGFKSSAIMSLISSSFMKGSTIRKFADKSARSRKYLEDFGELGDLGGHYAGQSRLGSELIKKKLGSGKLANIITRGIEANMGSPTMMDAMLKYRDIKNIPAKEYLAANIKDVFGGAAAGGVLSAPVAILVNLFSGSGNTIPGRDDAYNTIEGLKHGGMAGDLRKKLTEFGSGWDPLRKLARELFKEADDPFRAMIKSSEFKESLAKATSEGVAGFGASATASLMKGTFRGKEFKFIRKTGAIWGEEVAAMKSVQSSAGPSVYSHGDDFIDMEYFVGKSIGDFSPEELKRISGIEQEVTGAFKKLHKAGYRHGDPHVGNIMLVTTEEGEKRIGLIDFGASKKLSSYSELEAIEQMAEDINVSSGGIATALSGREAATFVPAFKASAKPSLPMVAEEEDMFEAAMRGTEPTPPVEEDMFASALSSAAPSRPLPVPPPNFPARNKPFTPVPGKDDAYNEIEGLRHGGLAEAGRKARTDFGSGWKTDVITFVKGNLTAEEEEAVKYTPHRGMVTTDSITSIDKKNLSFIGKILSDINIFGGRASKILRESSHEVNRIPFEMAYNGGKRHRESAASRSVSY